MSDSTASSQVKKIVLATGNPGKISEMRDLLMLLDVHILSLEDFEDPPEVVEDLPDLEGNALKKARAWHDRTGLPAVADDTGLEVFALNGAPGVLSARYAGEQGNADANMTKLLHELSDVPPEGRGAQFRTVVAIVHDRGEHLFEGTCKGHIASARSGTGGFGYDPIFIPDGYDASFAELSTTQKNAISHRGKAVRAAAAYLGQSPKTL